MTGNDGAVLCYNQSCVTQHRVNEVWAGQWGVGTSVDHCHASADTTGLRPQACAVRLHVRLRCKAAL